MVVLSGVLMTAMLGCHGGLTQDNGDSQLGGALKTLSLGDNSTMFVPVSAVFNSKSANFSTHSRQILTVIAQQINQAHPTELSIYVSTGFPHGRVNTGLARKRADRIINFFNNNKIDTRFVYTMNQVPVAPAAGLAYFYDRYQAVPQIIIQYRL